MKPLTLLEIGNSNELFILVVIIFLGILLGIFVLSLIIAAIVQAIHNSRNEVKYTKRQFWLTTLALTLIGGIISGVVCSGMV